MFARRVLACGLGALIGLACGPEPGTDSTAGSTGVVIGESSGEPAPTSGEGSGDTLACDNPVPIAQELEPSAPSGFVRCENDAVHRVEPVACEVPVTPSSCEDNSAGGCAVDSDCTEAPFGSCQQSPALWEPERCTCVYGCRSDADCEAEQICRCAGTGLGLFTQCISAGCASSADCDGGWCVLSPDACEPGGYRVECLTPAAACFGTDNCDLYSCITYGDEWFCEQQFCG